MSVSQPMWNGLLQHLNVEYVHYRLDIVADKDTAS